MSQADSPNTTSPSRRAVLAGLSLATPSVAAVDILLAARVPGDDPILAVIAAHKAAERAFSDTLTEQGKLETALPRQLRQTHITAWDQSIVETDDPRWVAVQRAVDETGDEVYRLALALLDIQPTTAAGMVSLFRHVAEGKESGFPEFVLFDDQDDSERGVDFSSALLKVSADWLDSGEPRITPGGAAVAALPIAAAAMADPIFAVLAEHREAMKAYLTASEVSGRLVDDTPEWNAAWAVTQAAIKREHAALLAVLTTQPTTIAGAVRLLDHVGQDQFLGEAEEDLDEPETILTVWTGTVDGENEFATATRHFPRRLAATMRNLTTAA
jgi:hypothetical protein